MPRPKKDLELTPKQKFALEEQAFEQQAHAWEKEVPACEHCGGRKGYNPVTGISLKTGHFGSCITLADKRAMVTTYNTSY